MTSEVTGKLPKENIAVDDVLGELTTSKEYKTLTSKEEVFNTHGANEMYNEIITGLGKKVNTSDIVDNLTSESTDKPLSAKQGKELKTKVDGVVSDFTTHKDNLDIHVTKEDKEKWDKVDDKVDKTSIVTVLDSTCTDDQIASAKEIYDTCVKDNFKNYYINSSDNNLGITDISEITSLLYITNKMAANSTLIFQINAADKTTLYNNGVTPIESSGLITIEMQRSRSKALFSTDDGRLFYTYTSNGNITEFGKWQQLNNGSLIYTNNDRSAIDFNSYTKPGTYFIEYNTGHLNRPTAYNGWLQVFAAETEFGAADKYIKQIFYRFGTPNRNSQETYERLYAGGSWANWTRITDTSNLKLLDTTYIHNLGLTKDSDDKYLLSDIFNALPEYCIALFDNGIVANSDLPFSGALGTFHIEKMGQHRTIAQFVGKSVKPTIYTMGINDNGGLSGTWVQHCTTTTLQPTNKAMTQITTFDDETNYKQYGNTKYNVIGGVCYINLDIEVVSPNTTLTILLTSLPKSFGGMYLTIPAFSQSGKVPLTVNVSNGQLRCMCGEDGCRYLSSFSYPVAE